ncbi:MAG TPA: ribonuclease P protein component [Chiayiivirga sp.]|nr:ribonuclease P protein component [Chiayiivirga sp.]
MTHAHRFPRSARVLTAAEFTRAFAAGRKANGRLFRCIFLAQQEEHGDSSSARLGMAISRKVDKRAVERNRIRRLIREWFRHRNAHWPAGSLIVTGRPEASGVSADQLHADLDAIARKLGLKAATPATTMPDSARTPPLGEGS